MPDLKNGSICFLVILLLCACSGKYFKTTVEKREAVNKIKCVAILPFTNLSDSAESAPVLTDIMTSAVNGRSIFRTVPAVDVEKQMDMNRILHHSKIEPQQVCELGKRVYAEGILTGAVTEYKYEKQGTQFTEPRIGYTISLYKVKGCEVIWNTVVARTSSALSSSYKESLSGLAMVSMDETLGKLSDNFQDRVLDFRYRCGPRRVEENERCARGKGGWIDFEDCPEAIPYQRLGREEVSLEGEEIIFNDVIHFVPGKAIVSRESRPMLRSLIDFMNENKIRRIRIESYVLTGKGEESRLSELNRAGQIRKYLVRNGLGNTMVDVVNFAINPDLVKKNRVLSSLRFIVLD